MSLSIQELNSFNQSEEIQTNYAGLQALGGVTNLEKRLGTSFVNGLKRDEVDKLLAQYGPNAIPQPPIKSFFEIFIESFEDTTLLILIGSAAVSLAVGLYENPTSGYIEGAAILFAVFLVAIVTSTNNYSKEKQFRALNEVKDNSLIAVIRSGEMHRLNVADIVVGDIVVVNAGDKIPADGIYLDGTDVLCDESSLTGESDPRHKYPALYDIPGENDNERENSTFKDVFLLSGTILCSGHGKMLVTSVGEHSRWGILRSKMTSEANPTPLQEKLDDLAGQIGNVGILAAGVTFLAMVIIWYLLPSTRRHFVTENFPGDDEISVIVDASSLLDVFINKFFFSYILKAFIMAVTIVVVAVPEGLPLAVTLSLAFSTQKMMKDNNLIRVLDACETMGNATTICSDKTGTLTQNQMTVVQGWVHGRMFDHFPENEEGEEEEEQEGSHDKLSSMASGLACGLLVEGIRQNSTSSISWNASTNKYQVTGNPTEGALLIFAKRVLKASSLVSDIQISRGDRMFPLTSKRKRMSTFIRAAIPLSDCSSSSSSDVMSSRDKIQGILYCKGAPEVVLERCHWFTNEQGQLMPLTDSIRAQLLSTVKSMAQTSLRTIALSHRVFHSDGIVGHSFNTTSVEEMEDQLVLDAILGLKDPLRPEVTVAVRQCQAAGIVVRMVTGDNIETAKSIARECGILSMDGLAMEGPEFRKLTPAQLDAVLPRLQVLARSSPEDKYLLVTRLNGLGLPTNEEEWKAQHEDSDDYLRDRDRILPGYREEWIRARQVDEKGSSSSSEVVDENGHYGEIVGVTGDGTNDGPALKAADVGLSMGLAGTDVAKEASDIVIMDDNFASIVKAVVWGRSVFDNIRKFLQFQLTVNAVALLLTFFSAVFGMEPPLNAVMMLWVNLIMDTMGALALGTENPSEQRLLDRKPYSRQASLISSMMWRHIAVQALFQLGVLAWLHGSHAAALFQVDLDSRIHRTIIFNVFVFCQVFNEINARSIDGTINVFSGMFQNFSFNAVIVFTAIVQYFLVQFGGDFVRTSPLTVEQWKLSIIVASFSLVVGVFMRFLPSWSHVDEDYVKLPEISERIRQEAVNYLRQHKRSSRSSIKKEE